MKKHFTADSNFLSQLLTYFAFVGALLLVSDSALATTTGTTASNDKIGSQLCAVLAVLQGTTAKAISVMAIIGAAFMFLTGNMKWTTLLMTAMGIVSLFAANALVNLVSGSTVACGSVT